MNVIARLYVGLSEGRLGRGFARLATSRGQTMTEYALILGAVAIAVYGSYKTVGTSLTALLTRVDGNL